MKLYGSTTSPYVRKVVMAAIELGLRKELEIENVDVWSPAGNPVAHVNPLGKLPTLVLDDGTVLYDSPVIVEYLDSIGRGARLIPHDGERRFRTLTLQALADGILDAGVARLLEGRRPEGERSPKWVERQIGIIRRGLDALEAQAPTLPQTVDLGMIAVLACLGWIEFRHGDLNWRAERPQLTAWFYKAAERDSFRQTVPFQA